LLFFIIGQILNCLSTDIIITKKYYENTKISIEVNFSFFFLPIIFSCFIVQLR